MYFIIN